MLLLAEHLDKLHPEKCFNRPIGFNKCDVGGEPSVASLVETAAVK